VHPTGLPLVKRSLIDTVFMDKPPEDLIVTYKARKKKFLDENAAAIKARFAEVKVAVERKKKFSLDEGIVYVKQHLSEFLNGKIVDTTKLVDSGLFGWEVAKGVRHYFIDASKKSNP
jgi:hypothetical protein